MKVPDKLQCRDRILDVVVAQLLTVEHAGAGDARVVGIGKDIQPGGLVGILPVSEFPLHGRCLGIHPGADSPVVPGGQAKRGGGQLATERRRGRRVVCLQFRQQRLVLGG